MNAGKILALILFTSFLTISAYSLTAEEAGNLIGNSSQDIQEMEDADIPTSRVENLLDEANRSYQAQLALRSQGNEPDFSRVEELTLDIQDIHETAFRAKDEIEVLEQELSSADGVNKTGAERQLEMAKTDYRNQRFSDSIDHVEASYQQLSEAQAVSTQVEAFIESQRKGIVNYVRANAKLIIYVSAIVLALIILFVNEFRAIKQFFQIKKYNHRKEVSENSLKDLDQKYFRENDISKEVYELRRDKYQSIRNEAETKIPEIKSRLKSSKTVSRVLLSFKGYFRSEQGDLEEARERLERITDEKEELEEQREKLEKRHEDDEIADEEYTESLENIKEKKDVLEKRISDIKEKLS